MNAALQKAHEARRRIAAERRALIDVRRQEFGAWLPRERELYHALQVARELHGPRSPECEAAMMAWRASWRGMPSMRLDD